MDDEANRATLRARILSYFREHPNAADTVDGVRRWWLADPHWTRQEVERALHELVESGSAAARTGADGSVVYSRAAIG